MRRFKNARAIIKQINKGEWEFIGHYPYHFKSEFKVFTAKRQGVELWLANGGFSCSIRDQPWQLGGWGFWVWHLAAKKKVKALERKMKRRSDDLTQ